jgi:hypothetical protein
VASESTGLIQVPVTSRFGMICDLLLFTGRATASDLGIIARPLGDVYDELLHLLNKTPAKAAPLGIPRFIS